MTMEFVKEEGTVLHIFFKNEKPCFTLVTVDKEFSLADSVGRIALVEDCLYTLRGIDVILYYDIVGETVINTVRTKVIDMVGVDSIPVHNLFMWGYALIMSNRPKIPNLN